MYEQTTEGKVFVIRLYGGSGGDYVLIDMYREDFLGINCLCGTYFNRKSDSYIGNKLIRIPCERIETIVEFESIDDFNDSIQNYYASKAVS